VRAPLDSLGVVALFEAFKGVVVLVAGFGLLALVHRDLQALAESAVGHLHLNPAKAYPRIFIDSAVAMTDARLRILSIAAGGYSLVRFVEAYGLWRHASWAEWFAAASGLIYVPFEIRELLAHVSWLSVGALLLNVLVVLVIIQSMRKRTQGRTV
jgi:uncharacterized membrane protein (DUF2068 family)